MTQRYDVIIVLQHIVQSVHQLVLVCVELRSQLTNSKFSSVLICFNAIRIHSGVLKKL